MDPKITSQLEEAKAHFYSWRLWEAYNVLRRFFDRIPFKPEKEHAEYVSMFARILSELGKERELLFYMGELEKWQERTKDPQITYSLGVVYRSLSEPKWQKAKDLFETLLVGNTPIDIKTKARLMLANYYAIQGEISACRLLIDAIAPPPEDQKLARLVVIWSANILRMEGKPEAAQEVLEGLLREVSAQSDWYAFFSAQLILSQVSMDKGEFPLAREILADLRALFEAKGFKSVLLQIEDADALLKERIRESEVELRLSRKETTLIVDKRRWVFSKTRTKEKLLLLLLEEKNLGKEAIIHRLYGRAYKGEKDDKLIYHHIHCLRKELERLGVSGKTIVFEQNEYRLILKISVTREPYESQTNA